MKLKKVKDIYDVISNCITQSDMKKIFNTSFDYLFGELSKSINDKGSLNNEEALKQFKKELEYIKEVIKSFSMINNEKYITSKL